MRSLKIITLGILIAFCPLGIAQTNESLLFENSLTEQNVLISLVNKAIERFEQTSKENWAYTLSRYENEEGDVTTSLEQFNPQNDFDKQWSLITINGEAPTHKQIKKFLKQKRKNSQQEGASKELSIQLSNLIKLESIKLISESDDEINATFNVHLARLGEAAQSKLQGRLSYNKHQQIVENIVITNKEEFSPMFSATITDFELSFYFIQIENAVLVEKQNLNMKGTFAFFTEIEEVSSDKFSNYHFVNSKN